MTGRIQTEIGLLAVGLLLLFTSGCTGSPVQAAAEGSLPGVKIPVGPIPGPAVEAQFPSNPYSGNAVAIEQGRRLFIWFNCYGCHGGHGGGGMGPSLRDPVWKYGGTDAQIFASISEGRSEGMPAWGTRIPEDQIWKIVAYIKTMRTPQEPEPPEVPPEPNVKRATR